MYAITLDKNGMLEKVRRIVEGGKVSHDETVWYAYMECDPQSSWFNGQTYVDTLNRSAISRFISKTHERYKAAVGGKFGSTVPCIFTDEPQFTIKTQLPSPFAKDHDVFLPWTDDLCHTFHREYPNDVDPGGSDLMDHLPELVWDLPDGAPSLTRYRYHEHVCERFVQAFMDQLGWWCEQNNLFLNGHMMEEPTLRSQTTAIGEAMRCYRSMQMPGIDLLNDAVEYNTVKQAASVARQGGRRGVMSEIYGCTHWNFTFEGHKGCGDWQAALGVTFRVHHLAWLSMAGEAKRDYPASINYQSPWYREYRYIEDHFARVGVAMTRGQAVTRVAVVHPIESYWLCFGPNGGTPKKMHARDVWFAELTRWLLHGLIDFDFISESLLPSQFGGYRGDQKLHVGNCAYEAVILPNLRTVRSSTLKILQGFTDEGGRVIIAGRRPELIDAVPAARRAHGFALARLADLSHELPWGKKLILDALDMHRDIKVVKLWGAPAETLLYQMRRDGHERFVFICNTNRSHALPVCIVHIRGRWDVQVLDTLTGEARGLADRIVRRGWTQIKHQFDGCASLLLRLVPSAAAAARSSWPKVAPKRGDRREAEVELSGLSLSEPNVLLLDYARYRIDDGAWSARTEVLRIDNALRDVLRLKRRSASMRQPWTVRPDDRRPFATVTLRFDFTSFFDIETPTFLALEGAGSYLDIMVNGATLGVPAAGETPAWPTWWVDEAISTLRIPGGTIRSGPNTVQLSLPFGVLTDIERIYILGKFNVGLESNRPALRPPGEHTWGDITTQGLPFYAGNITYVCRIRLGKKSRVTLSVPRFSNPVLSVDVRNSRGQLTRKGVIALQPRTLELGTLEAGPHWFHITAFGNRYNAFGHVHAAGNVVGCSPEMWRTDGSAWTDDYLVKPVGVLECPRVLVEDEVTFENMGSEEKEETVEEVGSEEIEKEAVEETNEDEGNGVVEGGECRNEKDDEDDEEGDEGSDRDWEVLSDTLSWEEV